jgi:hypothetical protein
MQCTSRRRSAAAIATVGAVVTLAAGCAAPPSSTANAPNNAAAAPTAGVGSRIDPGWLGFSSPDGNWKVLARNIAHDRQTLDLQPSDETFEFPNECSGCNHPPATAILTVYARGAYDPVAVRTGQPVTVNGGDGFFLSPRWPAGAVLAWQYGKNAWATAQGRSKTAGDLDRLLELAAQVHPTERTPVRFPLSLATLPADMPSSSVDSWGANFQTTLSFDGCGDGKFAVPVAACARPSDRLSIRLSRSDEFSSYRVVNGGQRREVYTVPVKIGGREGYLHEDHVNEAAIKVVPGLVVVFGLSGPSGPPADRLEDVLANVEWAPDPDDEATWPAVTDWAKGTR